MSNNIRFIEDMYPSNIIGDPEGFKQHVLGNPNLNDMQKLKYIFDISKDDLKKHNVQLYYAILGVLHSEKCMRCAGLLMPPSGYFDK